MTAGAENCYLPVQIVKILRYENGGVRRITLKQLSKYIPTNYVSFTFRAKILFIGLEK